MSQLIDDTVFSLILRFAGFNQELSFHDDEFLKKQLQEIKTHIDKYRPEERRERALLWIEQYASRYRDSWNKEIVAKEVSNYRCPDCPLCDDGSHEQCQIHDQWVELLQKYIAGGINSKEYIEDALTLLAEHKENLRVKLSALSLQPQ
ncbi:MAG: hypothetical protein QM483_05605 [Desulfuromusa sp.]